MSPGPVTKRALERSLIVSQLGIVGLTWDQMIDEIATTQRICWREMGLQLSELDAAILWQAYSHDVAKVPWLANNGGGELPAFVRRLLDRHKEDVPA